MILSMYRLNNCKLSFKLSIIDNKLKLKIYITY